MNANLQWLDQWSNGADEEDGLLLICCRKRLVQESKQKERKSREGLI